MSQDSPYTFHRVGADGEPTHYELRDVSGRVVCKAFFRPMLGRVHVLTPLGHSDFGGKQESQIEGLMREVVR